LDLSSFIGHESIKLQIEYSIRAGMVSHAHLIVGENGIGKSFIAKGLALKILGKTEDKQYADIDEYRVLKGKQSIGVDEIRDIIEEISKKPYENDKKAIIIYEADSMTEQAQNAFLKTIEEPPIGVFIILLCENLGAILDTIKSRCQIHKLFRLSNEDIARFLKRDFPDISPEEFKTALAFSDGIPGRAERFINDEVLKETRNLMLDILISSQKKDKSEFIKYDNLLTKNKDYQEALTWIVSYVRDTLVYKETGNVDLIINIDKVPLIKELAGMFSFIKLNDIIDIVNYTRMNLERNVNSTAAFDIMLIKIQK
jgi:DNA polymerase III subunit delta'